MMWTGRAPLIGGFLLTSMTHVVSGFAAENSIAPSERQEPRHDRREIHRDRRAIRSERGRDADVEADDVGGADDRSVDKIVGAVGQQIHVTNRMNGMIGL